MKKIGMVIGMMGFLMVYYICISYYHIDVTSYDIKSEKINQEVEIVMIGDLHDFHCRVKEDVIEKIEEMDPDIILCVGDMIDDQSESDDDMLFFLSELVNIADVYMSLGNHEITFYENHMEDMKRITDLGVHLLDEAYEDIIVNGNQLRIGGIYEYAFNLEKANKNETYQFLKEMTDTSSFSLMMAHRPDSFIFGDAYQWDLDLVVSGHVHGGQVILPFIGGLYAPDQGWFPKITEGLYIRKDLMLLVTRGISSSGEGFPRFNNPCEIVRIVLSSEFY